MKNILVKGKSNINGIGIFAKSQIRKGEIFYKVPLDRIYDKNIRGYAHIGNGKYACDEKILNFVNHSCNPNCILNIEQKPCLIAKKNINIRDKITVDYRLTEIEKLMFDCNCPQCHKKILVVNICKERFHELEFVKPIEDVLIKSKIPFFTKHYAELKKDDLEKSKKIIICGTSLKDNSFAEYLDKFDWIKKIEKPVFGICGGMHIIGLVFGGKMKKKTEIGLFEEFFMHDFFGIVRKQDVYHLHNFYVDFFQLKDFCVLTKSKIPQAVKHCGKKIYGTLFHPEVRQKDLIINFCKD
ncbi:MAG: glutamine amidotransferase-related protein [Nanoarchaeota archaeon]